MSLTGDDSSPHKPTPDVPAPEALRGIPPVPDNLLLPGGGFTPSPSPSSVVVDLEGPRDGPPLRMDGAALAAPENICSTARCSVSLIEAFRPVGSLGHPIPLRGESARRALEREYCRWL